MTGVMIPAVSTMTDSAERLGIALVVASTLFNLAYAAGETIGAPVAAILSQATSDAVPLLGLGALMLLTLIPARRLQAHGRHTGALSQDGPVADEDRRDPDEAPAANVRRPVAATEAERRYAVHG
jgi:hypothetical protein